MKRALLAMSLLCLAMLASPARTPAQTQMVPFKLFITELWQLDVDQDIGLGVIGDFYAKVTINGTEHQNKFLFRGLRRRISSTGLVVPLQLFKNFKKIPQCSQVGRPGTFRSQVPAGEPDMWASRSSTPTRRLTTKPI